jgi:hypothetical protein
MLHLITLIGGLKEQARRTMHPWLIWVGLVTLIFVHLAFLRFTLSPVLPVAAMFGVILVTVKHLGLIPSALARFRRKGWRMKGR